MPHPGKAERRKARRSKSAARKLARAKGTDSGAFSETGFFESDKPVSVAKRIQLAVKKAVIDDPAIRAARERRRRRLGGKPPTLLQKGRRSLEATLFAGIPGARSTSLLGVFGRFARTAGPGIGVRLAGRAVGPTVAAAAGGAVGAVVERKLAERGQQMPHRDAGKPRGLLPGVGGALPSKDTVVKVWTTGTANFARLLDGRIAVQKKDGTIKTYRPQKHIVIPRNPRVGTLIRADKRLERLTKGLRKVVRTGKR